MAGDDAVGYGKPPRHTRFEPGRSGNPAGRPKGPQSLPADLRAELEEAVTLRDGEMERSLSKQRAILRSLTAKAIAGDAKATAMVLDLVQRLTRLPKSYGGQVGAGPEPGGDPGPEIDQAPGPRERLAAKLAKIHGRLGAT
ncbi:MAG: DUF5681 domain-containing protein, partial [Kiloniellaceae bacterium]